MKCPECGRTMVLNFSHHVCEWCKADVNALLVYHGYAILQDERLQAPMYVFRHANHARQWRAGHGLNLPLKMVLSPAPFIWRGSNGSIPGLVIANRLYRLAPDHRFPVGTANVFVAPDGYRPGSARRPTRGGSGTTGAP